MTSAEFIQFGEQIANLHRCRIEDAPGSGSSPLLRRGQATVERLPDDGGDRCTALPRKRANPLVALIVDEYLQPVRQHTHTLACACVRSFGEVLSIGAVPLRFATVLRSDDPIATSAHGPGLASPRNYHLPPTVDDERAVQSGIWLVARGGGPV